MAANQNSPTGEAAGNDEEEANKGSQNGEEGEDMEDQPEEVMSTPFDKQYYTAEELAYRWNLQKDIKSGELSNTEMIVTMREVYFVDLNVPARKFVDVVNEVVQNIGGGNMAPARFELPLAFACFDLKEWQRSDDRLLQEGFGNEYGKDVKEMMKQSAEGYTEEMMIHFLKKADWEGLAARNFGFGARSFVQCKARFWFRSWALSEKGSRTLRERRGATEEKRMMRLIKWQGGTNTDWPLIAKELGGNRTPDWCFERFVRLKKDAAAEAEAESMKKKKRSP
ncbi:unnamed protein product [Linum trigynum]|uniref:Myb-like domain-containing protein n=1 Tax=Linum trigynum TaxID=586398 RepID=A0AAV2FKC9_9ROSI